MSGQTITSFDDWYRSGRLAPYLKERRGTDGVVMIEAGEPPGDMSNPPVSDWVLGQARTGGYRATCDFGAGRFRDESRIGRLYLVAAGVPSHILSDDPHRVRLVTIPTGVMELAGIDGGDDFGWLHSRGFDDGLASDMVSTLWEACGTADGASPLFVQTRLVSIVERLRHLSRGPRPSMRGGLSPWQTRRATEYLRAHLDRQVTLAELATVAGLSPFHFARAFKQATGLPPHAYHTMLRVEHAKALLAGTRSSITQIAAATGYEAPQTLARVFAGHTGLTPTQYRRQMRS